MFSLDTDVTFPVFDIFRRGDQSPVQLYFERFANAYDFVGLPLANWFICLGQGIQVRLMFEGRCMGSLWPRELSL